MALEHKTLRANGLVFHIAETGVGPAVLCLHGFPENWFSWRHQLPALADAGYRAVAMDLRGYGKSSRPTRVADYAIQHLRADVAAVIEALGGRAHLVAHDWGGGVAWDFAAHRGDMLKSLTIMNAPHPTIFLHHLLHNRRQLLRSWYMFFFQIPVLPEFFFKFDFHRLFKKTFLGSTIRKNAFPDEVIEQFRGPMMEPGAMRAGINYYRSAFRDIYAWRKPMPSITVPTQVIWADSDIALGPELCDGLDRLVTGHLEIHHIPDCSHWVQQEQPEQVNALLLDFLKRME